MEYRRGIIDHHGNIQRYTWRDAVTNGLLANSRHEVHLLGMTDDDVNELESDGVVGGMRKFSVGERESANMAFHNGMIILRPGRADLTIQYGIDEIKGTGRYLRTIHMDRTTGTDGRLGYDVTDSAIGKPVFVPMGKLPDLFGVDDETVGSL